MNTALISILLLAAAANVVLLVALLLRSSSNRTFAKDVREDLRVGREELRSSNKAGARQHLERHSSIHGYWRNARLAREGSSGEHRREARGDARRAGPDPGDGRRQAGHCAEGADVGSQDAFGCVGHIPRSHRYSQVERLDAMTKQVKELTDANQSALDRIRSTFDTRVEELKQSLDARVKEMQEGNERKLEEMRQTVDEKLQGTLEKRLGESFKFVSDRLEMVHKGLGEMQGLATGVGDLKRIFSNVKVRGTWAEVQLGGILEQMLTPDQWAKNVCVKEGSLGARGVCDSAAGITGRSRPLHVAADRLEIPDGRLCATAAGRRGRRPGAVQAATDALLRALKAAAKDIADKYVNPPATTDYAIMFLATEGLYAEALRQPQFMEEMQQKYRVVIAGPTTLSAIVSSLRMGFQTLVVEQRAAEVWRVLGAVKTEFGKFGGVLDKVAKQLGTATQTIEETGSGRGRWRGSCGQLSRWIRSTARRSYRYPRW